MSLEQLLALSQGHPLTVVGFVALFAFIWGLQAAIGANLGYRRGLVWQTGFLLSLIFSGLLLALYYSIRPLTDEGEIDTPAWLRTLAKWPSIVIGGLVLASAGVLELIMSGAPVNVISSNWDQIEIAANLLALPALFVFTLLGGYFGKLWYNKLPQPDSKDTLTPIPEGF